MTTTKQLKKSIDKLVANQIELEHQIKSSKFEIANWVLSGILRIILAIGFALIFKFLIS